MPHWPQNRPAVVAPQFVQHTAALLGRPGCCSDTRGGPYPDGPCPPVGGGLNPEGGPYPDGCPPVGCPPVDCGPYPGGPKPGWGWPYPGFGAYPGPGPNPDGPKPGDGSAAGGTQRVQHPARPSQQTSRHTHSAHPRHWTK